MLTQQPAKRSSEGLKQDL